MSKEEEKLNNNEQLALKIAEELSEGREFECDSLDIYKGAMKMADWKDQHPRKGLWDAQKVCAWIGNHLLTSCQGYILDDLRKAMDGK